VVGCVEGEGCGEDVDGHHLDGWKVVGKCGRACGVEGGGERCGPCEELKAALWMGLDTWRLMGKEKMYLDVAANVTDVSKPRPAEGLGAAERYCELVVGHKSGERG
jgi:hypothetical protein